MLAFIFEVDPTLANPDDLKKDDALASAAREKYDQSKTGLLTVLPCSLCYVPLAHFVPEQSLADLYVRANAISAFSVEKKEILKQRLNGRATLGQIEYIFDLGNWSPYFKGEEGKKYGTMLQILQYPFSVGSIHITPGGEQPSIDPKYYDGANGALDADVMEECARFLEYIAKQEPLSSIIRRPASPSAGTLDDGERLREWIKNNTITDWHPVGTCAMGGRLGIQGGVVDERLRVYGVKGLRVIDASIMPLQISAHIQATVYAIAEKGAHMIIEDARTAL